MAFGLCSCWTYLWIVVPFRSVFADSASLPRYNISHSTATFDQANQYCAPGFLTTFATKQEVNDILKLISESRSPQSNLIFWVGLWKAKKGCVTSTKPLRGFKWTENDREDSEEVHWAEEPEPTCISALCAAVKVEFDGSNVIRGGLISPSCRTPYQFICKLRDGLTGQTPKHRETTTKPATPEPKPAKSEPKPETPETSKPEPGTPEPKLPTRLEPETVLKPTTGSEEVGPDPGLGSGPDLGSCKHPIIPESRSLSPDPDNNRIQVECWSKDQLELHCRGHPAVWRLPDNSPANFTTICQRCKTGFRKDASANCVDIDECSSGYAHCRHTCLNTEGSYRCVCSDESGKHHEEDSPACPDSVAVKDSGSLSGILIPVLVAVVTLVVLVVVVVVTVKCCLMRKSKKKKAEKMAMKNKDSKDSFATANEKTAI